MPTCKSLPAVLLLIAGLTAASIAGARAAADCLAKPNRPAPRGQHWYYHHVNKHVCWYLRQAGLPVNKHGAPAKAKPASKAQAQPQPAKAAATSAAEQTAPPQPAAAASAAAASAATTGGPPADAHAAAQAAPASDDTSAGKGSSPWPEVTGSAKSADAAWPATRAPAAAQSASAGNDPPPPAAVAQDVRQPPAPDTHAATGAAGAQQTARARTEQPRPAPASEGGVGYGFALLMLLLAGLVAGGGLLLFSVWRRRREAADFGPPAWARVVALNAPAPRVRLWGPVARTQAAVAPPLAPADHTERLAHALQDLANRLRAQQEPAPSIVPETARRAPPPEEEAPPRPGRPFAADALGKVANTAARLRDAARRP